MPIASNWPARACASGRLHPETNVCAEARLAAPSARRPWITAGSATAQWKARSARRYPPPHDPSSHAEPSSHFAEAQLHARLTNPAKQNIITSIRGSRRQVADFKSEPRPASNRNQWPASYWNAWPASSESGGLCEVADARVGRHEGRPHISRIERRRGPVRRYGESAGAVSSWAAGSTMGRRRLALFEGYARSAAGIRAP